MPGRACEGSQIAMAMPGTATKYAELKAVTDAERDASRRHWLHRADLSLTAAEQMAEGPRFTDPSEIARYLKEVVASAARSQCLSEDDKQGIAFRALSIERCGYERFLDHVLELLRTAIRAGKKVELPALVAAFHEVVGHLRRLGLDDEGFQRVKTKLIILFETSAPGGQTP